MHIGHFIRANRKTLSLVLLGLLGSASGCGGDAANQPIPEGTSQAQQDAERAAREKAYGKKGIDTTPPSKR